MSIEAITIGFVGIDERARSAYQTFLENISWVKCVLVDDIAQAQVCIVDLDAYNIQPTYQELLKNYPDKIFLRISINNSKEPGDASKSFFLKKPVKKENFRKILKKISSEYNEESITEEPENNLLIKVHLNKISERQEEKKDTSDKPQTGNSTDGTKPEAKKKPKVKKKISTANAGKLLNVKNEEHLVGYQKNIDINDTEQLKEITYEPDKLIQTLIEKACINSKLKEGIVRLTILDATLYFDAQKQKVHSTSTLCALQSLCLTPHNNAITYQLKPVSFRPKLYQILQTSKNKTMEEQSWNMEAFVWLIALWSSRGRIAKGISLNSPIVLMQWPNLTRLAAIPHSVRIAALLYEAPYTLIETADLLGIEQRYVFAFYNACKAIGLAKMSQRKQEKEVAHKHYKNPSILKKVLGKLFRLIK